MDLNGRYNHIEDVLVYKHTGQWFTWSDTKNKVYENIVLIDKTKTIPSEKELTDALAKQQADFDALEYSRKRASEYPSITDQLDEIFHNGIDSWKAIIKQTKDKYPKG